MNLDTQELLQSIPPGMITCMAVFGFIFWGGFWAIFAVIFQRNLKAVPEEHRKLSPYRAWWLVPFPVAFIWLFVVVSRISASWKSVFQARGDETVGQCGKPVGMTSAVLALVSNLLSLQIFVGGGELITSICGILSTVSGLVGFIALIVYLVLINDLKIKSQKATTESAPIGSGIS
ncbi:MAG: hypothetical protein KDN20_09670 [Verrucomicrobiae bacterium]|nr:hypothetical protein [Verrucomicrobiae bacterium]